MSQHDFNIANQGFPAFRADLNNALGALATNSAGSTEPSTTYAYQYWYDETTNLLKMRNADDDAWITLAFFDQTNDEWEVRSAVIQAVDSAGVVIKTDDGTTRLTIADDGSITTQGDLTVGGDLDVSSGTIKLDGNYPVGTNNVACGNAALSSGSLSGDENTAIGSNALASNTSGRRNTAVGEYAAQSNQDGEFNVAIGRQALEGNVSGDGNIAIGQNAMLVATASNNVGVGNGALLASTTGAQNVAIGYASLEDSTTGIYNTAIGFRSGELITTGSKNTIVGRYSGNQDGLDIRTSSNNIVLSDGDGNPRGYYQGSNGRWTTLGNVGGNISHMFRNESSSTPYLAVFSFNNASPDNNAQYFLQCTDSSADRLRIYSDGDVVNHDNSYGAISDIKLKEQITDASSQWDDIKSLNIRKYKMKSDVAEKGDSDEHWRLGVIAQEVEEAGMSGLIKTSPDMIENEDGELVESGEYTKQVKYSILYMKAVKALQEAMDRIETLEAKVAALESN